MKKISTVIGLIIIVVAIAIFFGGVFAYQYFFVKPQPVVQTQASRTAGWKTYKSTDYDYEIKYPSAFEISNSGPIALTGVPGEDIARYKTKDYFYIFDVFARNADFIINRCLKDLSGNNITKTKEIDGIKFYAFEDQKKGTGGRMALVEGSIQSEYHAIHNNYCYIVEYTIVPNDLNYLPSEGQTENQFKLLDQIFSTFKFTTPETDRYGNLIPKIDSVTPASGPKGTVVEIKGVGLAGFEGDLDVYFERSDGKRVMLTDTFGDYMQTHDKLIKVVITEPCQAGSKVYGRYSGIITECDYVELTPGMYKVYVDHSGTKSNIVNFEITVADFPFRGGDTYAHAKQVLAKNGWIVNNVIDPDFKSAGDGEFPEIGDCGIGIDAICSVDFKKGDEWNHLNVQIGGRPPYGPYSEWTVIGNE